MQRWQVKIASLIIHLVSKYHINVLVVDINILVW